MIFGEHIEHARCFMAGAQNSFIDLHVPTLNSRDVRFAFPEDQILTFVTVGIAFQGNFIGQLFIRLPGVTEFQIVGNHQNVTTGLICRNPAINDRFITSRLNNPFPSIDSKVIKRNLEGIGRGIVR